MKTKEQREKEFRSDLQELLSKHKADMEITDDGKSYGQHSGICIISMSGVYDKESGDVIEEYTEFNL